MSDDDPANQVHDLDLWQLAQTVRELHQTSTHDTPTRCRLCATAWPCPARQAADDATRSALRHPADLFLNGEDYQISALRRQLRDALNDLAVSPPTVHTRHRGATCSVHGGRPVRPARRGVR